MLCYFFFHLDTDLIVHSGVLGHEVARSRPTLTVTNPASTGAKSTLTTLLILLLLLNLI